MRAADPSACLIKNFCPGQLRARPGLFFCSPWLGARANLSTKILHTRSHKTDGIEKTPMLSMRRFFPEAGPMGRGFSPGLPKPNGAPTSASRELTGPGSRAQGGWSVVGTIPH